MTTSSLPSTQQSEPSSEPNLPDFIINPKPEVYLGNNYATIDFEVSNFDKGSAIDPRNRIVLAVCRLGPDHPLAAEWGPTRTRAFFGSEFEQETLKQAIGQSDFFVAHNAKFELQWLHRAGADLRKLLPYCTMLGEYVRAGNRRWPLSLDATARRYGRRGKLSLVQALIHGGVCPSEIPPSLLEEYCTEDVDLTEAIFLEQRKLMREEGLLPVFYCRNIFTPVLASIEFEGLQLDSERVRETYRAMRGDFEGAKRDLDSLTGGINQNSSKQLRHYLYEVLGFEKPTDHRGNVLVTSGGVPAVGKGVLEKLKPSTPEQRRFLDAYRRIQPLKKKVQILESMQQCCDGEDNGQVFAAFNQSVTQTHRLSSSGRKWGFQFQNFPRAFKPLFRTRDAGCVLVEGDAPQLEFRVAVDLGNDDVGFRAICQGVDVHQLTSRVMGLGRTEAKPYTFKPLYGGSSGSTKERAYYEAFRREYSSVYNTQRGWVYKVLADKTLRIASGLVFYWPDTAITRSGYVTNTPSIFNYPVQSFATADIVPISVTALWHRLSEADQIRLVNTVHDSVIAEVPKNMVQYYRQQLIKAFTEDVYTIVERLYGRTIKVPLGVGIKIAEHWGDTDEEEKVEADAKKDSLLQSLMGQHTGAA
jgi:DNA polymerase I-like protein with 3'-5' exonuclease and polymerase domains